MKPKLLLTSKTLFIIQHPGEQASKIAKFFHQYIRFDFVSVLHFGNPKAVTEAKHNPYPLAVKR